MDKDKFNPDFLWLLLIPFTLIFCVYLVICLRKVWCSCSVCCGESQDQAEDLDQIIPHSPVPLSSPSRRDPSFRSTETSPTTSPTTSSPHFGIRRPYLGQREIRQVCLGERSHNFLPTQQHTTDNANLALYALSRVNHQNRQSYILRQGEILEHSPAHVPSPWSFECITETSPTRATTSSPHFGTRGPYLGQREILQAGLGVRSHNFPSRIQQNTDHANFSLYAQSRINHQNRQSRILSTHQTPLRNLNLPARPLPNRVPTTRESTFRKALPSFQIRKSLWKKLRQKNRQKEQINPIPRRTHILASNDSLTIAVDATPRHIGGYCINPFQGKVHYYSVPSNEMPWTLVNTTRMGDSLEFEMKNLMCALLLWINLMKTYKSVIIYTDNSAILSNSRIRHTKRIFSLLSHLQECEQVEIKNLGSMFLSSREDRELFQTFIVPADHLSRRKVMSFMQDLNAGAFPNGMSFQREDFNQVRQAVLHWRRRQTCQSCGFGIGVTASLRGDYQ